MINCFISVTTWSKPVTLLHIINFLPIILLFAMLVIFYWNLNDSKSPQISRTLLSILADLNCAVVWIVLIHLPISNSSSCLFKPLESVPSTPITIGITVNFMFHSFLSFFSKVQVLVSLFTFFNFHTVVWWDSKVHYTASFLFFLLIISSSGLLARIRWSVCISKSKRSLCIFVQDRFWFMVVAVAVFFFLISTSILK